MLERWEQETLDANMASFGHIVELVGPAYGEPFIHNGRLYYFDGDTLTLYPEKIDGFPGGSLEETVREVVKRHNPKGLLIWGHSEEKPEYSIKGYEIYYSEQLPHYYSELRILDPKPSRKMRRAVKRAEKEGIRWSITKLRTYKAEWQKIIADTHEGMIKKTNLRLLLWYAMYPLSERTKILEAKIDDELVGVQIIYDNSPRYVCLAEIGYNKSIKRAAEIVEALAISYYMERTKILSIGGSPKESIWQHKIELFKNPKILYDGVPFWDIEYRKEGSNWDNPWWFERMLEST